MKLRQLLLFVVILLTSCFLSFTLFSQPTTTGLLAYFKLNGNTTNSGPANITASAIGTSYTTNNAGAANNAVQFAGNVNSYLDFTDNGNLDFSGTTNFTISFSFYFNGTANSGLLDNCLNYGGWGVWFWKQNNVWNIQFNYKNASVGSTAATAFTTGLWHHVAAVRNNGTISIYIDGIFRLSATEGTMSPSYPINMIAGAMAYGGYTPPRYNPFGGKIDEIRVYNRALSASEIAVLTPYSLPMKLGDFTAVRKPAGIQLNWETITEQNTSHFEIERSSDGINYTSIGAVIAAGNATDKKYYSFTDNHPLPGINFYRLKMADIDRTYTHSRVIAIKNDNSLITIQIFPNPVTDVLQVQIPSLHKETIKVSVADAAGRIIYERNMEVAEGNNAASIPVQQLPKGNFYLVVDNREGRQAKPFIKQ